MANTPAAVQATYATNIVSALDLEPVVLNRLMQARGDQGLGMFEIMKSLGFVSPTTNSTFSHFEDDWIHEIFHSDAIVAQTGAGVEQTIVLDSTDLDANTKAYPRVGDLVMYPGSEMNGIITNVDVATPDITVEPILTTDNLPALAADDELVIFSNANGEGTDQPGGRLSKTVKETNNTQIIKETMHITGTQMNHKNYWTSLNDGRGVQGWHALGSMHAQYRLSLAVNMALLWGTKTDNATAIQAALVASGVAQPGQFLTTEGLIPYARRVGTVDNIAAGALVWADIETMIKNADSEMAGSDILGFVGIDFALELNKVLATAYGDAAAANTSGTIASASPQVYKQGVSNLFGGNEALSASVDFQSLNIGGYNLRWKKMPVFSHPKLGGAVGYNYRNTALWIPFGRKAASIGGQKTMMPNIGCRHLSYMNDRMVKTWATGANAPGANSTVDDYQLNFLCDIGGQWAGGNAFYMMGPDETP